MKKAVPFLLAVVLLFSLLSVPSLALDAPAADGVWLTGSAAGFSVTPCAADGSAITADTSHDCDGDGTADTFYAGAARFTVTYAPASGLVIGDNYTIIMYTGDSISVDTILYLDQITVSEADVGLGSLTFDVFPASMEDAVIKVTSDTAGFSGPVTVTTVHTYLSYKLGDVDEDGKITTLDAVKILQYYVGSITLTTNQKNAADTDGDGKITTIDAVRILQYYVGSISSF